MPGDPLLTVAVNEVGSRELPVGKLENMGTLVSLPITTQVAQVHIYVCVLCIVHLVLVFHANVHVSE